MFNVLAHSNHYSHRMMGGADYHTPIIVGLIFLVVVLSAIIILLLTRPHPVAPKKPAKKTKTRKK